MKVVKSSIKKNLAYQTFYEILQIILPLITSPYISRVLGAERLGIFSYTYSIAYYFQLFGMLGIKFYGNRAIAIVRDDKEKTNQIYSEILTLHILFSIISTAVYVIFSFNSEYQIYSLLQVFMVLSALFDISWLFFGLENFKATVIRNSIIKILSVVMIFVFVHQQADLWKYILIMASSQLIGNLFLFVLAKKYVKYKFPPIKAIWKHLSPMLILFIPVISNGLFKYMDKIMLGALGSKEQLGFYENAEKILNIPLGVVLAFGTVMLPKMSNLIANNNSKAANRYIRMSIKYMLCIAIAMAFGMAGIATNFAPIFWGTEFSECGILIMILSISLPFSTVANIVRNQDLIPNGKDKYYSIAICIGAAVNLLINGFLIPSMQAIGVSIGTVVAEILVCAVQMFMVEKNINYRKYITNAAIFLIPGIIMFITVYEIGNLLGRSIFSLIIQVITGVLIYGGIVLAYFIVTKDEECLQIKKTVLSLLSRK